MLAGGPITAMLDSCCGMAVATLLKEPKPFATLDLRIDYAKPADPKKPVIAEAECYRITRSVAFTRAFAHQGDPKDPVAAAAGTFMLGTKGEVTRSQRSPRNSANEHQPDQAPRRGAQERDVSRLAEAIPYAKWMHIAPETTTGELLTRMRYHDTLIGNTHLPAIHGGTLGAMLEMAAIFHLLWETDRRPCRRSSTSPSTTCARPARAT